MSPPLSDDLSLECLLANEKANQPQTSLEGDECLVARDNLRWLRYWTIFLAAYSLLTSFALFRPLALQISSRFTGLTSSSRNSRSTLYCELPASFDRPFLLSSQI